MSRRDDIAPAGGRLGVLLPGLGAVSTTLIAGVEAVRRGLAQPVGCWRAPRAKFMAALLGAPGFCSGASAKTQITQPAMPF